MEINYDFMADLARDYEYQYQVEELYGKLIAHKLDEEFGVYVSFDERSKYFRCDAIGLNVSMNKLKDYNELFDMIQKSLSEGEDDAKLKDKFKYLFDNLSVESKVGEFHNYSRSSFNTASFFDLLWWIKKDEFIRDASIGYKLMNVAQDYADKYPNDNATFFYPKDYLQYQIRYGEWIDMTTVDSVFSGWQIKFFQNNKVQMKGLSNDDWDKIVYADEICSKK